MRGSRIKNIVDELGGERIDIVRWNESLQVMIPNALQPAAIDEVFLYPRMGRAIVLVKEGRLVGFGSGQTSRVDAARQAVDKARAISGPESTVGASCASDAFYPFPDGVEVCLVAGVTAFVQPGGSIRDAEIVATADAAGATMVITGTRHFRH